MWGGGSVVVAFFLVDGVVGNNRLLLKLVAGSNFDSTLMPR